MNLPGLKRGSRQKGTTAVEFALVAVMFFTLLFSMIEFARFFYAWNTAQEVTRRAARAAVVAPAVAPGSAGYQALQRFALFGDDVLGFIPEVNLATLSIVYLNQSGAQVDPAQEDQLNECPDGNNCIYFVEASIPDVIYQPIMGYLPLTITIPASTVQMPVESLGYVPPV